MATPSAVCQGVNASYWAIAEDSSVTFMAGNSDPSVNVNGTHVSYDDPSRALLSYVCEVDLQPCPAGHACPAGSGVVLLCPAGTYSLLGASACSVCPTGTVSAPGSSSCSVCASAGPGSSDGNDSAITGTVNGVSSSIAVADCAPDTGYGRQECSAAALAQPWAMQTTNRSVVVTGYQICPRHLFGTVDSLSSYVCATELANSSCHVYDNGCCAPGSVGVAAKSTGDWIVGTLPASLSTLTSVTYVGVHASAHCQCASEQVRERFG